VNQVIVFLISHEAMEKAFDRLLYHLSSFEGRRRAYTSASHRFVTNIPSHLIAEQNIFLSNILASFISSHAHSVEFRIHKNPPLV